MSLNKNNEIVEKIEQDNIVIEYPKNYETIVDFKLKRLEKEYQETINKNFKKEDLENNEDFNSDSDEEDQKDANTQNDYYQCLDGDEFVDVYEDHNEDNKTNKEDNLNNADTHSQNYYQQANLINDIDEKQFQEFVKFSDKVLEENKEYLDNLNSQQNKFVNENIYGNNNSKNSEAIKNLQDDKNSNEINDDNNYDIIKDLEFVSEKGK